MKISVKGFLIFKRFLDSQNGLEIHIPETTLENALILVGEKLGDEFCRLLFAGNSRKVKTSNQILLNGQNYLNLRKKMHTPLKDGDEIILLPMVTGG